MLLIHLERAEVIATSPRTARIFFGTANVLHYYSLETVKESEPISPAHLQERSWCLGAAKYNGNMEGFVPWYVHIAVRMHVLYM